MLVSNNENQVTVSLGGNGFEDVDATDRLIQGALLRCVDGRWSAKDESPVPAELIVLAQTEAIQKWKDRLPVETITKKPGEKLPDVDELNKKIPEKEWDNYDGSPRPPFVHQRIVYLLDPNDASIFTYINSTVGADIATTRLRNKVKWMRVMRGSAVHPLVKLGSRPMKTKRGQKIRPEFEVIGWRDFSTSLAPEQARLGKPVAEPTLQEEMGDELPEKDWDAKGDALPADLSAKAAPKTASKKK